MVWRPEPLLGQEEPAGLLPLASEAPNAGLLRAFLLNADPHAALSRQASEALHLDVCMKCPFQRGAPWLTYAEVVGAGAQL
jgi:hypothetical protein